MGEGGVDNYFDPVPLRAVHISHNDLDGVGCVIMLRKALGSCETYMIGYNELEHTLEEIEDNVHLYITDISLPEKYMIKLKRFSKVTIIDHHDTTKPYLDIEDFEVIVDTSHCAAWLLAEHLVAGDKIIPNHWLDQWAVAINDYDMWLWPFNEGLGREMNALLQVMRRNDVEDFIQEALDKTPGELYATPSYCAAITDYIYKQDAFVNNVKVYDISKDPEIRVGLAFSEQHQSLVGNRMIVDEGYDVAYIISMATGGVSIRANKRFDCSKMAREHGGGGHKPAAGFQFGHTAMMRIIAALQLAVTGLPERGDQ